MMGQTFLRTGAFAEKACGATPGPAHSRPAVRKQSREGCGLMAGLGKGSHRSCVSMSHKARREQGPMGPGVRGGS